MGNRSNVRFVQSEGLSFYLYSHWAGMSVFEKVREALAKCRDRWTDENYGTAFVVGQVLKDYAVKEETTGYGLGAATDNGHDVLEVDFAAQKVRLRSQAGWFDLSTAEWERTAPTLKEWTFAEFAKLPVGGVATYGKID